MNSKSHGERRGRDQLVFSIVLSASIYIVISPLVDEALKVIWMAACAAVLFLSYGSVSARAGAWPTIVLLGFSIMLGPNVVRDTWEAMSYGYNTLSFAFIPGCLAFGYILSLYSKTNLYDEFERRFLQLSVLPAMAYAVFFVFRDVVQFFPSYTYGGFTHKTIGILNVLYTDGYLVVRNAGFASEPGFYQILVNIALAVNLRRERKLTLWQLYYAALVVSTQSTAGLVIMASLFAVFLPLRYKVLVTPVFLPFVADLSGLVQGHLDAKFVNNDVLSSRFTPSARAWEVFFSNPGGIGARTYTEVYQALDIGSYDAYSQVALRYGIFGLAAMLAALASVGRQRPEVLLVLALSFLSSPIWFFPTLSMFYFYRENRQPSRRNVRAYGPFQMALR